MRKNYNIYRKHLELPEYGRHIHQMVDNLMTIEDREERNHKTRYVISVMGNINPFLRDTPEFTHKLWDHLFIMSDFKLDVDSPYPIPTSLTINSQPRRLKYPDKKIVMKHYGKYVKSMINVLEVEAECEAVREAINNIARFLRTKSYEYNQEHPNNEVIIKDIKKMSNSGITVDENAINLIKSEYKKPTHSIRGKKSTHPRKNNKNNKNQRHYAK